MAHIDVDLRYASNNNFLARNFYGTLNCAFLRAPAAQALAISAQWLITNYPQHQLRVLDALRPQRVQEMIYHEFEGTPTAGYLAHPTNGSIHSFGMALDVTVLDANACELDMGSGFDDLTEASHTNKDAEFLASGVLSEQHIHNRNILRNAMHAGGFQGISMEWWHFDLGDRVAIRRELPRVR
jgi:D-alanyl-D-alanine dipeptidase